MFNLKAAGSPQVLASASLPLSLAEESRAAPLYFLANFRNSARGPVAAYIRALESLAQDASAARMLVRIRFTARQFERVVALYKRVGSAPFEASPEGLAQVALSFWQAGDRETARRLLASAQALFPNDSFLIALAKKIGQPPAR